MDTHIALDDRAVVHAGVGIRPLGISVYQADIYPTLFRSVASQLGGGGRIVHQGFDVHITAGRSDRDGASALQISFLGHGQIGLGIVHTKGNPTHIHRFTIYIRSGGAAAAVHQNVQLIGIYISIALDAAAGGGSGGGNGLVGGGFDCAQGEALIRLGGFGLGIGLVLELDADIFDINIRSGAVEVGRKGTVCLGVHNHDTQVGTINSVSAVRVAGKGIALGIGQDIQIAAVIAGAAERSTGNIRIVFRLNLGIRGVGDDALTADIHISSFQLGLRALILIVIEPRGNVGIVLCLYAAAGNIGALPGRDCGLYIADPHTDAGNGDLWRVNGSKGSRGSVADDLNAINVAAGYLPSGGDIAVGDCRTVGSTRVRVSQIHLAADEVNADLRLLRGGLSPGGKVASDVQRSRMDSASADLCCKGAVGFRLHADRTDIHQAQIGDGFLGISLGIALGVTQNGNRAGGGNVRAGDGGHTCAGHFRLQHIYLGTVFRRADLYI